MFTSEIFSAEDQNRTTGPVKTNLKNIHDNFDQERYNLLLNLPALLC